MASLNEVLHKLARGFHPDDSVHADIDEVAPVETEDGKEESSDAQE